MIVNYSDQIVKGGREKIQRIEGERNGLLDTYTNKLKECQNIIDKGVKNLCDPTLSLDDAPLLRTFGEYYQEAVSLKNAYNAVLTGYADKIDAVVMAEAIKEMLYCVCNTEDRYHGFYKLNSKKVFNDLISMLPFDKLLCDCDYKTLTAVSCKDFLHTYLLLDSSDLLEILLFNSSNDRDGKRYQLHITRQISKEPFTLLVDPRFPSDPKEVKIIGETISSPDFSFRTDEDHLKDSGKELVDLIGTVDLSNIPKQIEDKYLGDSTRVRKPFFITKID